MLVSTATVLRDHADYLYGTAIRRALVATEDNHSLAEEIAQDAICRAFAGKPIDWSSIDNPRAYAAARVRGMVTNALLSASTFGHPDPSAAKADVYAKRRAEPIAATHASDSEKLWARGESNPDADLEALIDCVRRNVPHDLRDIALLAALGKSQEQIGAIVGQSVRTIKRRLADLRRHLT